jgi:hypothetical protein
VSFVRKDLVENIQETTASFPVEGLDFPNKTDRADIFCPNSWTFEPAEKGYENPYERN